MKKSNLGFLLVLLVFATFAVSVLMVLLTGADVVQGITERDRKGYGQRTVMQYLATRVHQADQAGMISVRETEDGDRLVLAEKIEESLFESVIYCHDGYLRELFCASGYEPEAEFGEKILPAERFYVTDREDHLELEITFADGERRMLTLQIRSERGANYEE